MSEEYYVVSKSNLEEIADHIRAKGGTSAGLSFPSGFESAIDSIPTVSVGPLSVTANGTYTATAGTAYSPVTVNVPTGIGTLIQTTSLGLISTTATSATDTGKTVTVSNINGYDALLIDTSIDATPDKGLLCSCAWVFLTAGTDIETKEGATIATVKYNARVSSAGVITSRASTTSYGIFPNSVTVGSNQVSFPIYMRYSATYTGTINANYTTRVYGVNLMDLIGG